MIEALNQVSSLSVHIGKGILEGIVERAKRDWPLETCGLLLGWRAATEANVAAYVPAINIAPKPSVSYEIDPHTVLRQISTDSTAKEADQNPRLIGFYHSHPSGSADPSPRDLAEAWPDMLHLIVRSKSNRIRFNIFWHNSGTLYATEVDRPRSTDPALTRFSQGSTITVLHRKGGAGLTKYQENQAD